MSKGRRYKLVNSVSDEQAKRKDLSKEFDHQQPAT